MLIAEANVISLQKEESKGGKPAVSSEKKNKTQNAYTVVKKSQTLQRGLVNNLDTKSHSITDLNDNRDQTDANNLTEKTVVHFDKILPTSDKHVSCYVKNFLDYSCEKRTKINDNKIAENESKIFLYPSRNSM